MTLDEIATFEERNKNCETIKGIVDAIDIVIRKNNKNNLIREIRVNPLMQNPLNEKRYFVELAYTVEQKEGKWMNREYISPIEIVAGDEVSIIYHNFYGGHRIFNRFAFELANHTSGRVYARKKGLTLSDCTLLALRN